MCWITPLYLYWLVFEKSLKANRHPLVLWMCSAAQLCPALCNPMNCNPPGSSVHGILPARILKWGAISSSRDFPDLGIEPVSLVSCLGRQILYHWATWEIHPLDKSNVVRLVIILKVGAIFKCLLCILSDINQFLSIYCDEPSQWLMGFPGSSDGQESASNAADPCSIPGSGRSPEKGMATHFPILAWRIPWIEKPGRLQPTGSQRVGNDWATNTFTLLFSTLWLIRWILLSSYSLYMRIFIVEFLLQLFSGKESTCNAGAAGDSGLIPGLGRFPGGGHGNPLQYSCLENPMDRGAWHATVHRVTKSDMTKVNACRHMIELLKKVATNYILLHDKTWKSVLIPDSKPSWKFGD